ncbi:MAG: Hsp70 family protein [Planctomycetales bacterium]
MLTTHAVGIDLGTTYSCIAYLNEHGEPVTLPNQEGELATPSVVMFDGDEVIVGTEALRNSVVRPGHVVQNSKRFMGDPRHHWSIDGKKYTPVHIATFVLKKLLASAQEQIGAIEQAVITVPAQFSDAQRQATVESGLAAGLQRVDVINEPVAAALCYVLGTEGLWFTELANEQRIMVYDLGGGTFDLSLVKYRKNEVSVIASAGDLNLGGIDWSNALLKIVCDQFAKETGEDPRADPESLQYVTLEAEQTKRSLTVRPKAALTCQHAARRRTYQITLEQFEKLTQPLVERTAEITRRMLKDKQIGWAHVDVVLTTGGASRMPMVRNRLKALSGTTLNTSLSPDQSIAHGATYYAGMLLTNDKFARSILSADASERLSRVRQQSVNARALGILVRDPGTDTRVPHYLVLPNTPLPAEAAQTFGTVVPNQQRVHLQIVESGTSPEQPAVRLGSCVIDALPPDLPEGSAIEVTIRYDAQARVHVSARDVASGKEASTEIIRQENLVPQLETPAGEDVAMVDAAHVPPREGPAEGRTATPLPLREGLGEGRASRSPSTVPLPPPSKGGGKAAKPAAATPKPAGGPRPRAVPLASGLEHTRQPVPLCNACGEPLDARGRCPACGAGAAAAKIKRPPLEIDEADILDLDDSAIVKTPPTRHAAGGARGKAAARPRPPRDPGEVDFWNMTE